MAHSFPIARAAEVGGAEPEIANCEKGSPVALARGAEWNACDVPRAGETCAVCHVRSAARPPVADRIRPGMKEVKSRSAMGGRALKAGFARWISPRSQARRARSASLFPSAVSQRTVDPVLQRFSVHAGRGETFGLDDLGARLTISHRIHPQHLDETASAGTFAVNVVRAGLRRVERDDLATANLRGSGLLFPQRSESVRMIGGRHAGESRIKAKLTCRQEI